MNRFLKLLTAVLPMFAAILVQYIVVDVLYLINVEVTEELQYFYSVLGIMICGIVFFFWYRKEGKGSLRGSLKNIFRIKYLVLIILLGFGCQLFFSGLMSLIIPYLGKLYSDYSMVMEKIAAGNEVVVVLLTVLIAPITEELIFRGVTLHIANRYITFWGANILQACLFGIYHGDVIQGVYAAILGFLLGAVYYKFRTILAPILLHAIINSSAFLIFSFPNSILCYIIILVVGGVLIVTALFILKPLRCVLMKSDTSLSQTNKEGTNNEKG